MSTQLEARSAVQRWYSTDSELHPSMSIATDAYNEAVKQFSTKFADDECKKAWIGQKHTMADVQKVVEEAKAIYILRSQPSNARLWLEKFSSSVLYYEAVFDTFGQGAPEYVSFAWGVVKFLLKASIQQAEIISKLAKGLTYIADALPHVELRAILYPTDRMKGAVAILYARILEFLQRAAKWYREPKAKHALMAIVKPYSLHFKDLLEDIASQSREIDRLAASGSMAEQRDMHLDQKRTHDLLVEMRDVIFAFQKQSISTSLDTNKRVCDMQFSQILTFAADPSLPTPEESRKVCQAIRNRRKKLSNLAIIDNEFYSSSSRLQAWASSTCSCLLVIQGSFPSRYQAKDFAINLVDLAVHQKLPVVWVLNPAREKRHRDPIAADIMKQLIFQILRLNQSILTERSISLSSARLQSATTEKQWFDILGSVIDGLDLVYIIIDIECLSSAMSDASENFSWVAAFRKLFEDLRTKKIDTVVKVLLVSYLRPLTTLPPAGSDIVFLPKQSKVTAQKKRLPMKKSSMQGRKVKSLGTLRL